MANTAGTTFVETLDRMALHPLHLTQTWTLSDWQLVAEGRAELILSPSDRDLVAANRAAVERGIESGRVVWKQCVNPIGQSHCPIGINDSLNAARYFDEAG